MRPPQERGSRFDIRPFWGMSRLAAMKTLAQSDPALRAWRPRAPSVGRIVADAVLLSAFLLLAALFLAHGGFIGNGDIQPYPY